MVIDQGFDMLRPTKHSAMVPTDDRESVRLLVDVENEAIEEIGGRARTRRRRG